MVGEGGYVFATLAQGRHADGEDVDAVEQVLAKGAGGDHLLQILVGGGDQPDVGALGARATDGAKLPLLHHAQQFRLGGQRQVGDFVEEQRTPGGELEHALLVGDGTGE